MNDALEKLYAEHGSNICVFPFLSAFISTFSYNDNKFSVIPCTIGTNALKTVDSNFETETSLVDAYNEKFYINLRQDHMNGRGLENPYCANCKRDELNGATSARQMNNQHMLNNLGNDVIDILRRVKENDYKIRMGDLVNLGHMPSNYCNQACIMCSSGASSKRAEFERQLGKLRPNKIVDELYPSDLDEILKHVRLLDFAGGETLIQPQVLKFIDSSITNNTAKDIKINILTNLSRYDRSLFSKLEHFAECFMTCSMDGIGKFVEYQRIGAKWNSMSENMISIARNHPGISYVINYVVTAVSAMSIPDMIKWCKENQIAYGNDDLESHQKFLIFSPVRHKDYLNIDSLPAAVINNIIQELEAMQADEYAGYKSMINDALSFLRSYKHNPILMGQFKRQMLLEDSVRSDGMTLKDIFGNTLDG